MKTNTESRGWYWNSDAHLSALWLLPFPVGDYYFRFGPGLPAIFPNDLLIFRHHNPPPDHNSVNEVGPVEDVPAFAEGVIFSRIRQYCREPRCLPGAKL